MKKHVEMQTIKGELMQKYVVLQVTLKEKLIGTASKNLSELEDVINKQADKGISFTYHQHNIWWKYRTWRRWPHPGNNGVWKNRIGGIYPYLWSGSKGWMRALKANIQPAATKATNRDILSSWIRLFLNFLSILCHSRIKIESPGWGTFRGILYIK